MARSKKNKLHFIGIGGFGMSGLAEYALQSNFTVTGSDINKTPATKRLESLGAKIFYEHSAANISPDTKKVVYTSAVKNDNPELKAALNSGITVIKRAEMLGELVNDKFLIAVAGTHGKTTTTAMIGNALAVAGLDPVVFVGGNVSMFNNSTFRMGKGNYAVVEADEYDRSFLTLRPDLTVITNIDEDHLDIYDDIDDIKETFIKFLNGSKKNSVIIFNGDDPNSREVISKLDKLSKSFGFNYDNTYRINRYDLNDKINFNIINSRDEYNDITISLPGRHNIMNAAACFVVSNELKMDFAKYRESMLRFVTVERRLQLKFNRNNIRVYDDYAHHPEEIGSSLTALKEFKEDSMLITVFQPHLYTRTRDFYREFAEKLSIADEIILLDIYPAREKPIAGITSSLIFNEIRKNRNQCLYINNKQQAIKYLLGNVKSNDIVVFQGAGDITEVCNNFIAQLKDSLI